MGNLVSHLVQNILQKIYTQSHLHPADYSRNYKQVRKNGTTTCPLWQLNLHHSANPHGKVHLFLIFLFGLLYKSMILQDEKNDQFVIISKIHNTFISDYKQLVNMFNKLPNVFTDKLHQLFKS